MATTEAKGPPDRQGLPRTGETGAATDPAAAVAATATGVPVVVAATVAVAAADPAVVPAATVAAAAEPAAAREVAREAVTAVVVACPNGASWATAAADPGRGQIVSPGTQ